MELGSDSDSDSDLEFLAGQASPQRAPPAGPARAPYPASASRAAKAHANGASASELEAQIDELRREMWEKLGENVILRSQLESSVSNHERELGELINRQTRAKDEFRLELERQKREVEKERIQIQFLQAELRSRPGAAASVAPAAPAAELQPGALTASPSKRRARAPTATAALSDGFVLKKQRILPSFDASQASAPAGSQLASSAVPGAVLSGGPSAVPSDELRSVFALLASHRAPGFSVNTMELLYTYRLADGDSVGARVAAFSTPADLVDTLLAVLSSPPPPNDDCVTLALALLYALLSHGLALDDARRRTLSALLCEQLLGWLKKMSPLPEFDAILPPFLVPLLDLKLLTWVLYALDILISLDGELDVSHELLRRLFTSSHAPHVVGRAVSLLCRQPQCATAELVKLVAMPWSIRPSIELLFTGLVDVPELTLAQVRRELPSSENYCRLARSTTNMAELEQRSERQAARLAQVVQSACIQLAFALQFDRPQPAIAMHSLVLTALVGHIDCPSPATHKTVGEAVLFFWTLEPARLRDELNEDELAELEVCLSKLVYAPADMNETVERGKQLLQALAGGADSDLMFEAFEPPAATTL